MAPIPNELMMDIAPDGRGIEPMQDPQFLHGFWKSISMILVSEIADKTFFIAAIMSAQYPRLTVFLGSIGALIVMTILSVVVGNIAMQYLPSELTDLISAALFVFFGCQGLYEGIKMKKNDDSEFKETQLELKERHEQYREYTKNIENIRVFGMSYLW